MNLNSICLNHIPSDMHTHHVICLDADGMVLKSTTCTSDYIPYLYNVTTQLDRVPTFEIPFILITNRQYSGILRNWGSMFGKQEIESVNSVTRLLDNGYGWMINLCMVG